MNQDKIHKIILAVTIILIPIIIMVSGMIKDQMNIPSFYTQDYEEAIVRLVLEERLEDDPVVEDLVVGRQVLALEVLTGKHKGFIQDVINTIDQGHQVVCHEGQRIIVGITENDEGPDLWVYAHKRSPVLYILIALFLGVMIYFGGKQGFYSIVALLFTATMFIFVMVPMIFNGFHPIVITIICAIISAVVSFILIGGYNEKSFVAILGTMMGIIAAGLIAFVFGKMANITAVNMDKGTQLVYVALEYGVKVKGLLFASILIASMGAVMDVSMSIASSIQEIYQLNPKLTVKQLYKSGMSIGRDIMGTMSNTLILAFMGGSLGLMLIIWGYNMEFVQLINMPFLSVELIQGLAGSIGIVLTVPFTALIASLIYKKGRS
ncbi:YibE/F family protein [Acidaminobacter sp. JC074]|uniref:YibE/F family protein n=1 Tax=Acidaminobacter sp. JC074 TaxID=2530199 RepID=UPI001F0FDF0B|nr:YibE/F family protein [Acidaminobacter sp. JC074]MCH4889089.1 YibE/F family protein [Acidaminobacter sp. JC074]